jgi:hypothetical protein
MSFTGAHAGGATITALPVTSTFLTELTDAANRTTYTFSSVSLGAADSSRKIVMAFGVTSPAAATSVTCGGVTASLVASVQTGNRDTYIYQAAVPIGTTGDIVATWASDANNCSIGTWRVVNAESSIHDSDTDYTNSTRSLVTSINIPAGGCCIAVTVGVIGSSMTYTNLTERYDSALEDQHSGASDDFSTLQTGLAVLVQPNASESSITVVSYGPA